MKKMLKENKGFSLVELLVAILIMAVIAGTAITLFGGVLNSSRQSADEETAESIKRAILTYMNSTNDVDLNCLNINVNDPSIDLIERLGLQIKIENGSSNNKNVNFVKPAQVTITPPSTITGGGDASDINGTFGPFLDITKDMNPKTPGSKGWAIQIDRKLQVVTVDVTDDVAKAIVTFVDSSGTP